MLSIYDTSTPLRAGAGGTVWYGPHIIRRSLIEARVLLAVSMLRNTKVNYHPDYVLDTAVRGATFRDRERPCRGEGAIIKRILRLTYPEFYYKETS